MAGYPRTSPARSDHDAPLSMSDLDDAALTQMISCVLDDVNLLQLSSVCLRWSAVVCQEECWALKEICISGRPICKNAILAWFPRWRRAHVAMTFSQRDALPKPICQAHTVRHHWGVYHTGPGSQAWHHVNLDNIPCLVCITAERGPTVARVFQYNRSDESIEMFREPTTLGWTSAARPEEFASLCSRMRCGRQHPSDVIVATTLCPSNYWCRMLLALRAAGMQAPPSQPVCFDEGCPVLGTFVLDRSRRAIQMFSHRNRFCEFNFPGGPIDNREPLTFFVAVPQSLGPTSRPQRLPRLHLQATNFYNT